MYSLPLSGNYHKQPVSFPLSFLIPPSYSHTNLWAFDSSQVSLPMGLLPWITSLASVGISALSQTESTGNRLLAASASFPAASFVNCAPIGLATDTCLFYPCSVMVLVGSSFKKFSIAVIFTSIPKDRSFLYDMWYIIYEDFRIIWQLGLLE